MGLDIAEKRISEPEGRAENIQAVTQNQKDEKHMKKHKRHGIRGISFINM